MTPSEQAAPTVAPILYGTELRATYLGIGKGEGTEEPYLFLRIPTDDLRQPTGRNTGALAPQLGVPESIPPLGVVFCKRNLARRRGKYRPVKREKTAGEAIGDGQWELDKPPAALDRDS
jgi:hypothetical protein